MEGAERSLNWRWGRECLVASWASTSDSARLEAASESPRGRGRIRQLRARATASGEETSNIKTEGAGVGCASRSQIVEASLSSSFASPFRSLFLFSFLFFLPFLRPPKARKSQIPKSASLSRLYPFHLPTSYDRIRSRRVCVCTDSISHSAPWPPL